jgi:hypothetical protein
MVLTAARARLAEIDPEVPPSERETGMDVVRRQTAQFRLVAVLLTSPCRARPVAGDGRGVRRGGDRRQPRALAKSACASRSARHVIRLLRPSSGVVWCRLLPAVPSGWSLAQFATTRLDTLLFNVSARDPLSGNRRAVLIISAAVVRLPDSGAPRREDRSGPGRSGHSTD